MKNQILKRISSKTPLPKLKVNTNNAYINAQPALDITNLEAKRTILDLNVHQFEKVLEIRIQVHSDLKVEKLWARRHDEWIHVANFTKKATKGRVARNTYSVSVNLENVASQLASHSKYFSVNALPGDDVLGSGRYHLYVGAASDERRPPKIARETEIIDNVVHFRYPLGRARVTRIPTLKNVKSDLGSIRTYVNSSGALSVAINDLPQPYARIQNYGASIESGVFNISGLVYSRHTPISKASVLLLGRTSGFRAEIDANLQLKITSTRKNYGHRRYGFHSHINLIEHPQEITDDILDIYLEFESPIHEDIVRKRIGVTRYLVRRKVNTSSFKQNQSTVNVVPYYTFKAKKPSFQLEVFDNESFEYLESQYKKHKNIIKKNEKPIWLLGEMPYKAQDNALFLFKYLQDNRPEIDSYYVIREDSVERRNLEGYDNVINYRSKEHIELAIRADKLICTHQPLQLYPTRDPRFAKLVKADHVFIQHGVVAAKWIGEYAGKNATDFHADLTIVSSEREKEFFHYDLGYKNHEIAVTGLARFDSLFNDRTEVAKKQIFIMPTWRYWLQDPDYFIESDYYINWFQFLSSPQLKELVDEYSLDVVFCLHPNMQQFSNHFDNTPYRVVYQGDVDVQEIIKSSSMMITDYSSAALDFSFLHKPVIFFQFDAARFPEPHADANKELPGTIVLNANDLVQETSRLIQSGFVMDPQYIIRANNLIKYRDTSNCHRITREIENFSSKTDPINRIKKTDLWQTVQRFSRKNRFYLPLMRRVYGLFKLLPMNSSKIVFESSLARQFNGNPKAIYDELRKRGDNRLKIIVSNKRIRNNDPHTIVVKRNSMAFFWHLATAKTWINDQNFADFITRRKRGVYIQTWHGTPLKKMLLDQEEIVGRDEGYLKRVTKSSSQWNCLVSPNAHTSNALRSAYGYKGKVFELGYPRNDILINSTDEDATSIRQRIGISCDKKIVLYAPTFRDNLPTSRGRFAFQWPFSPEDFHEHVDDDVVFLVRTHTLINTKVHIPQGLENRIIDVSSYPDIQELYLISDMLITDYSSVFFDFAILNRPIAFYAYDLDLYRNTLRGFYLDYDRDLPGPVVESSQELFNLINRTFSNVTSHDVPTSPIDPAFLKRFAPHEDGRASARVIDELL